MEEILKTIKNLLFSYSSVFLVIIFAIMQSDHSKYDKALDSIRELQLLVSDFDTRLIENIVAARNPGSNEINSQSVYVGPLGANMTFRHSNARIDYRMTNKNLMGDFGGFNFNRSSVEKYPDDFVTFERLLSLAPPLQHPDTLGEYHDVHDAALQDTFYEQIIPKFDENIRLELYRDSSGAHNSIEGLTTNTISDGVILDPIKPMTVREDKSDINCELIAIRTETNDRHGFFCHIGKIEYNGQSYRGGRVFIPAQVSKVVLSKDTLIEAIGIPKARQIKFDIAHRELAELASPYPYLTFEDLDKVLSTEKNRTPATISVIGAQVNVDLLAQLAFGALTLFFVYLFLHLRECKRQYLSGGHNVKSSWVAIYPGIENLVIFNIQLFVLPAILLILLIKKDMIGESWMIWVSFGSQFIGAVIALNSVLSLRAKMKQE